MKVTCITPTTHNRALFNERISRIFNEQDYADKEHIFCYDEGTVGEKRNTCCKNANGDIIIHMDSDDLYATDWISKSVKALLDSGAHMVGLKSAFFYQSGTQLFSYDYKGGQPYVCGATMCYLKNVWQRSPFRYVSEGEDLYFCMGKRIMPHNYKEGFTAILHDNNTCSHKAIGTKEMGALPLESAPALIHSYYSLIS